MGFITSRFLFTLTILIVLGVNISATTQTTSSQQIKANLTKQARTGNFNDPHFNNQQVWNPNNRFEMTSFLPSAILFAGLLLLLIPLCLSLFSPFFFGNGAYASNPFYNGGYAHGRRKRDIAAELNKKAKSFGLPLDLNLDALLPSASSTLNTVITTLGKSIQNFNK